MDKFYAVHALKNHGNDFELVGVFTNESDAKDFVGKQEASGMFLSVGQSQHLGMDIILDMLVRDRLRELAIPIMTLATREMPNG